MMAHGSYRSKQGIARTIRKADGGVLAARAIDMSLPDAVFHDLQDRFDAGLVTVCAYGMHRFGAAHRFLDKVGKRTGRQGVELVALLLGIPCFHAHQLFFEIAYAGNQRRLRRLHRQCAPLGGHDFAGEFDRLRSEGLSIPEIKHRLRDIASRAQRSGDGGNGAEVHGGCPSVVRTDETDRAALS